LSCDCGAFAQYADEPSCLAGLGGELDALRANAATLGLTYQPGCVNTQAALVTRLGCASTPSDLLEFCEAQNCAIYAGQKQLGEACNGMGFGADECAPGLKCGPFSMCIEPTCLAWRAPGAEGELCNDGTYGRACADGLVCDRGVTDCCRPPYEEGEACGGAYVCAEGLSCFDPTQEDPSDATCVRPVAEGEPCFNGRGCAEGLTCRTVADQFLGVCASPLSEGDACLAALDCASENCLGGVCVARPVEGEPCSWSCADDTVCNFSAQPPVCAKEGVEGGPCRGPERTCEAGLRCNNQLLCVQAVPDGEPCDNALQQCGDDSECVDGACRANPGVVCGF
jgi:hypothetical protein